MPVHEAALQLHMIAVYSGEDIPDARDQVPLLQRF